MKKLIITLLLGLSCAVSARAEITAGNSLVSGYFGGAAGLQSSGVKINGDKMDWGSAGALGGVSYLFFPTPYFGLGVSLGGNIFSEDQHDVWAGPGSGRHTRHEFSMFLFDAMAAGRVNFNPQSDVRIYLPFGIGLTSARGKYQWDEYLYDWKGYGADTHGTTNSLGWYAGLGAEIEANPVTFGFEMRYHSFEFDKANFGVAGYEGNENYSYLSFLFLIGYKF